MVTPAPPTKISKIMQALGEAAYSRSPILGQAMEVAEVFKRPDHANDPTASRMKNIGGFVANAAIQRSPVLNKMAQAYDFIKSLKDDQAPGPGPNPPPTPPGPGPNPPPGPGPTPPNPPPGPGPTPPNPPPGPGPTPPGPGPTPPGPGPNPPGPGPNPPGPNIPPGPSLNDVDDDGPDALPPPPDFSRPEPKPSDEIKEVVSELTKSIQEAFEGSPSKVVEFFDDEKNIYYKSMEESRNHLEKIVELLQVQAELMQRNFKIAEETNERLKNQADLANVGRGGNLTSGDMLPGGSLRVRPDMGQIEGDQKEEPGWMDWLLDKAGGVIAGGAGGLIAGGGLFGKVKSLWSKTKGAAKWAGKGVGKAAKWGTKILPLAGKLAGPLAAASAIYSMNEFENRVDRIAEERGISKEEALAIAQGENRESMENTFRSTPGLSQLMQIGDWTQKQGQNLRSWWNKPKTNTQELGVVYSDSNATFNRMIQDYTRDGDGFTLSPDAVRQKILNSQAAINNQSRLDIISKSNTPTTQNIQSGGQPPTVIGGPTNINNNSGGNVTNIYNTTSGDSLGMPSLPSSAN